MQFHWTKAALVGSAAGFLSGLLGIGGGIIIVPGLILLIGLTQRSAAATSSATIVASSTAALYALSRTGNVNWSTAAIVFIGASVGAFFGARYLDKVPEHWLAGMLATVMALASIRMWI